MYSFDEVLNYDPEVARAMEDELTRQRTHIELIASENLVSISFWSCHAEMGRKGICMFHFYWLCDWRMRICGCC